jgi:hypothetical protein
MCEVGQKNTARVLDANQSPMAASKGSDMTVDQHASVRQPIDTDHAERAILGGLLLPPEAGVDETARNECLELPTAAFADARHRTLFRVLKELLARGPADEILVTYALQKNGHLAAAGGMAYVACLTESCVSPANLPHYAQLLRDSMDVKAMVAEEAKLGHFATCYTPTLEALRNTRPPRLLLSDANDEHGMFPRQHVSLLAARGGTGKSHLTLQLAVSVASGRPFLSTLGGMEGFDGNDVAGNVLLWSAEDGADIVNYRLAKIVRSLNLSDEEAEAALRRIRIQTGPTQLAIADHRSGTLIPTAAYAHLEELLSRDQWDLIIIDSLAIVGPPEIETHNVQAHSFLRDTLAALAARTRGEPALVLTHHTGKGYQRERADQDAIRGASGIVNGAREAWLVGPLPPAEGQPPLYTLACVKANLQAPSREDVVLTRKPEHGAMLWQATAGDIAAYFAAQDASKVLSGKRRGNGSHSDPEPKLVDPRILLGKVS